MIASLITFGASYGSLGLLALFKDPEDHDSDFLAWMIMCVLMSLGYTATACVYCMNDALASNYARKNNLTYSKMRIWTSIGWASGAFLVIIIGDVEWLPFRMPGIIVLTIAIITDVLFLIFWPYEDDFEMFHDGSTVEQRKLSMVGPNTMAYLARRGPRGSISHDMLARIREGRSKSVGNLPRMNSVGIDSKSKLELGLKKETEKEPEKQKEYSNFQCQMLLMKLIATNHISFIRYIFLFTIFGIVWGMLFTYQLDFFKARVAKDQEEFEYMAKFCMIAQALLGEIPVNYFANDMLRWFGASANMSIALITLGMRCFFYGQLLPYLGANWVAIAEALQGPSCALYWILIVDIGSNYALMVTDFMPELKRRGIVRDPAHEAELSGCLRASMIGAMSSSMEGLGTAIGSFLGGILSGSLGYDFMWNFCTILAVGAGLANIYWDISRKLIFKKQSKKKDAVMQSKRVPSIMVEDFNSSKL